MPMKFKNRIKEYLKKYEQSRPAYRIVYVDHDRHFGTYYKIEQRDVFRYRTYYFDVPDSPFFEQQEFRFKTYDDAKEELDLLIQGKSKYNCYSEVVYETPLDLKIIEQER